MLEDHEFCDDCPGCKPCLFDPVTKTVMAKDSPPMRAIMEVWDNDTTYQERKAFFEVTVHNSRDPIDMGLLDSVNKKFKAALEELENSNGS